MSILDTIQNQFGGDTMSRLSSLIGEDENKTRDALGAAVPTLLAGLANQTTSSEGLKKITSAVDSFDTGLVGNFANMLTGGAGSLVDKGSSMLNSLLGGGMVSSIASAISRYSGVGSSGVQKLLALAMPLIMGNVASQFRGKSMAPQGIAKFFSNLLPDITRAMPSGFSLSSIPGLSRIASAVQQPAEPVQAARFESGKAESGRYAGQYSSPYASHYEPSHYATAPSATSAARWLVPLLGIALAGLLGWSLLRRTTHQPTTTPVVVRDARDTRLVRDVPLAVRDTAVTVTPNASQIASNLAAAYDDATKTLAGITDAASAQAALPRLTEINRDLESMKNLWNSLPDAGRSTVRAVTTDRLPKMKDTINRLLTTAGVGEILRPVLEQTISRMTAIGA